VIKHHQQLMAAEEAAAKQHAWGTGEATVVGVRLEGSDGEERRQFLSGGPLVVRLAVEVSPGARPPGVAVEFRDASGGLLGASEATPEELGWETGRAREVCFEVPRLPLSDGLFRLSVALGDPSSTRQYHRLDPAAEFTVFPDEHSRGWFRFEGDWSLVQAKRPARTA
jgi:hypothetical protein